MQAGHYDADGRTVRVTDPDGEVFPDIALTKADLRRYHERISGTTLPRIPGRPVVLKRYPEGVGQDGFFQKEAPDHLPN